MRPNWVRYQKLCVMLSTGVTLGILQGLTLVNFAQLFTEFLARWLSVLVALFLGADADTLTNFA